MTGFDLSTIQNCYIGGAAASAIYLGSTKIWPTTPPPSHDYSQDYLTIVSLEDNNNIYWDASDSSVTKTISVSTDGGSTWANYTSSAVSGSPGTLLATLNTDDELLLKGNNMSYGDNNHYNCFVSERTYNVQGNIMSLIYGDNYIGQTILTASRTFSGLFSASSLVNAQNLILPATTLTTYCYYQMFNNCSSLTTAPALPATTLVSHCYANMFLNCDSLTTAPALPATTLAEYCYESMFFGCDSLTTAPALPATTLADYCYNYMFRSCDSLTTAPALPATTLAEGCYWYMFYGCTSLIAAPELPATTLVNHCYGHMFQGCTSLTTPPELPATTLVNYCYYYMFFECSNLTTAPDLPAKVLTTSCYGSMFNRCTSLNYIKCLATDISATDCLLRWAETVPVSGTFVKDANTTWPTGSSGIPSGWTVQNAA